MKITSLVDSYSDFIQTAVVSRVLRQKHQETLVYIGPHTDYFQVRAYFEPLNLPEPEVSLELATSAPGASLGEVLLRLERVLLDRRPDLLIVRGQSIPVARLDAGVRAYHKHLPEELNNVLTDRLADVLFCNTQAAVQHLAEEGIISGVHFSGDLALDTVEQHLPAARQHSSILQRVGLYPGYYLLAVVQHFNQTQPPDYLRSIIKALNAIREPIICPMSAQARAAFDQIDLPLAPHVLPIDPIGYLDMLSLEKHARAIITDVDSLQREAYCLAVPCITLREETGVRETVDAGWNRLVGGETVRISEAVRDFLPPLEHPPLFGDGHAAERIAEVLGAQPVIFGQNYDRVALTLHPGLLVG
jgi:UDP-GlcNAc3NAcA epimerase